MKLKAAGLPNSHAAYDSTKTKISLVKTPQLSLACFNIQQWFRAGARLTLCHSQPDEYPPINFFFDYWLLHQWLFDFVLADRYT